MTIDTAEWNLDESGNNSDNNLSTNRNRGATPLSHPSSYNKPMTI